MASGGQVATNYFVSISELSAHNTASAAEVTPPPPVPSVAATLMPILPYAPFVLAALLFAIAFGLMLMDRVKNVKNVMAAFLIAMMVASTPMILNYVQQGGRQEVHAGTDEIPRVLNVRPAPQSSVDITWHTDAKHTGVVKFGASPLYPQNARVYVANDRTELTDHSIRIGGLKKGTVYKFEILSGTTWFDNNGQPIQFTY